MHYTLHCGEFDPHPTPPPPPTPCDDMTKRRGVQKCQKSGSGFQSLGINKEQHRFTHSNTSLYLDNQQLHSLDKQLTSTPQTKYTHQLVYFDIFWTQHTVWPMFIAIKLQIRITLVVKNPPHHTAHHTIFYGAEIFHEKAVLSTCFLR